MFSFRSQNKSVFALARKRKLVNEAPESPPMNIIQINRSLRSYTPQNNTLSIHRHVLINYRMTGMNGYIREIAVTYAENTRLPNTLAIVSMMK